MENEEQKTEDPKEEKKKNKTLKEKLEAARLKVKQLEARKQLIENRERAKTNKIERAKETRRKILLGSLVLSREIQGETSHPSAQLMAEALTRDDDRALFGLSPLSK